MGQIASEMGSTAADDDLGLAGQGSGNAGGAESSSSGVYYDTGSMDDGGYWESYDDGSYWWYAEYDAGGNQIYYEDSDHMTFDMGSALAFGEGAGATAVATEVPEPEEHQTTFLFEYTDEEGNIKRYAAAGDTYEEALERVPEEVLDKMILYQNSNPIMQEFIEISTPEEKRKLLRRLLAGWKIEQQWDPDNTSESFDVQSESHVLNLNAATKRVRTVPGFLGFSRKEVYDSNKTSSELAWNLKDALNDEEFVPHYYGGDMEDPSKVAMNDFLSNPRTKTAIGVFRVGTAVLMVVSTGGAASGFAMTVAGVDALFGADDIITGTYEMQTGRESRFLSKVGDAVTGDEATTDKYKMYIENTVTLLDLGGAVKHIFRRPQVGVGLLDETVGTTRMGKVADAVDDKLDDVPLEGGLTSTIGGTPIDPEDLARMKTAFERNGGSVLQGEDSDDYLLWRAKQMGSKNVGGLTHNAKEIMLPSNASRSAVFEEFIHTTQYRTGKVKEYVDKYGNICGRPTMAENKWNLYHPFGGTPCQTFQSTIITHLRRPNANAAPSPMSSNGTPSTSLSKKATPRPMRLVPSTSATRPSAIGTPNSPPSPNRVAMMQPPINSKKNSSGFANSSSKPSSNEKS